MKNLFIVLISCLLANTFYAQEEQSAVKEGPYFLMQTKDDVLNMPLLSSIADVNIAGPIADVTVDQMYKNNGANPIEAIYVFPASTRAAIYHLEMQVGNRIIKAKIKEKNKARAEYVAAKNEGKRASLLEQHRPNVFQMNVANIMPSETIIVKLKYTEFIIPTDQMYTFNYPMVVGPRYAGSQAESYAANPYLKKGSASPFVSDIKVDLHMGIPISDISSTSHKTTIQFDSPQAARIRLNQEKNPGNRDYILNYKLVGDQIQSGITTFFDGNEHFFLCQIEPPNLDSKPEVTPREYIFIIDVSGSMNGFPLDISKELMRNLLDGMNDQDKFNIVFFAGGNFALSAESIYATKANIKMAFEKLDGQNGSGGTQILPAVQKAMSYPKDEGYSRSFVIITDGYVTVEEEVFDLISCSLNKANFFAFGIGKSVNRHLIEGMAHVGRAEPFIVTDRRYAKNEAKRLKKYIEYPILSDISIKGAGVNLYDLVPEEAPDLMAARPIYYFGKYNGDKGSVEITGKRGAKKFKKKLLLPSPDEKNKSIRYLWAREKIRFEDDFNSVNSTPERIRSITDLGLKYNLLTKYTSFVAIDKVQVAKGYQTAPAVKQTLSLPMGVSNYAVGFEMVVEDLIVGFDKSVVIQVDIIGAHHHIKLLLESILQQKFKELSAQEISNLIGLSVSMELMNGQLEWLADDHRVLDRVLKSVNADLAKLGFYESMDKSIRLKIN